jgi:hypothetical protein
MRILGREGFLGRLHDCSIDSSWLANEIEKAETGRETPGVRASLLADGEHTTVAHGVDICDGTFYFRENRIWNLLRAGADKSYLVGTAAQPGCELEW